jgi:hypothetical protein
MKAQIFFAINLINDGGFDPSKIHKLTNLAKNELDNIIEHLSNA